MRESKDTIPPRIWHPEAPPMEIPKLGGNSGNILRKRVL
jgi:hypothetical protein